MSETNADLSQELVNRDTVIAKIEKVATLRTAMTIFADHSYVSHPRLVSADDGRSGAIRMWTSIMAAAELGLVFIEKHLLSRKWWDESFNQDGRPVPENTRTAWSHEYMMLLKVGLIHGMAMTVETSFRLFVRALDPVACEGGDGDFQQLHSWLLARFNLHRYDDPANILRLTRNSFHNNGVHFPKKSRKGNKQRTEFSYALAGKTYEFIPGQSLEFISWDFVLTLAGEIGHMLIDVLLNAELSSLATVSDKLD